MKHTYKITGMSCDGCRSKVEKTLNTIEGVDAQVTLSPPQATISMKEHIPTETMQKALGAVGNYGIEMEGGHRMTDTPKHTVAQKSCCSGAPEQATQEKHQHITAGKYYCPMHCEGDKEYDTPGDCPVCGMDLVQQPVLNQRAQYTCPMHPEVIKDEPGSCPICGMDLVPLTPDVSEESKVYDDLWRKMKIALLFTIPSFLCGLDVF